MATAEQNLELLRKILNGIRDDNLNDVMSENGFDVSKSTEKSSEWVLKKSEEEFVDSETTVNMMVYYTNKQTQVLRFPDNYKEKQFIKYIRDNPNVESVKTIGVEPELVYK